MSVLASVLELLPLMQPLRQAWSKEKFSMGQQARAGQLDEEHSVNIEKVDAAIQSLLFWGYCHMLAILSFFLLHLTGLLEGCPCHHDTADDVDFNWRNRQQYYNKRAKRAKCVMGGRWAPQLAAGLIFAEIRRLLEFANNALLIELATIGLSDAERAIIMRDFEAARRHVWLTFSLKFGFWGQLPWLLFGIAHNDTIIARSCARKALQLFDAAAAGKVHHYVTLLLLMPGSVGREQLEFFARGQRDLMELPFLSRMAARFMFATVVERWVESLHRLKNMATASAPNAGIVHVAYQTAMAPIQSLVSGWPDYIEKFAVAMREVKNPVWACHKFGLWNHPHVQSMLRQSANLRCLHRKHRPDMIKVLYHVDIFTLFQNVSKPAASEPLRPPPPPSLPPPSSPPPDDDDDDDDDDPPALKDTLSQEDPPSDPPGGAPHDHHDSGPPGGSPPGDSCPHDGSPPDGGAPGGPLDEQLADGLGGPTGGGDAAAGNEAKTLES
jgi:hypothetical protein